MQILLTSILKFHVTLLNVFRHLFQRVASAYTLIHSYHRFRWYATLENKTLAETFPKFPSILRVVDMSDRNPPIKVTSVTYWPYLRHASGLWLVDFDPTCRQHVRLTEILETFPRVFCFPKSRINENGGKIYNFREKAPTMHFRSYGLKFINQTRQT